MTREENLKRLNDIYAEMNESENAVCYLTSDDNEVIQCAIKALEQEPCEDCISRQALLEEIENGINAGNYEEGYEEYAHINNMDDIVECIKYADRVQPKADTWSIKEVADALEKHGFGRLERESQTNILDKIRAELLMMECMEDAVEVIDKYRQEGI